MKYLIDTHILLWHMNFSELLPSKARAAIENTDNTIFVNHSTLWELAIKVSTGKLSLTIPFLEFEEKLTAVGFSILPFSLKSYEILSTLPFLHKDPFDRMIIAQGVAEDLTIISSDKEFSNYDYQLMAL